MAGLTKVESCLMDLDLSYQEATPGTFFIDDPGKGLPGVVVTIAEPVVILRAKVMPLPKKNRLELFETLLKLNASDIVHGAYAIDGPDVILVDTLEFETLDEGELEAALDSIGMALSRHYVTLGKFRD